MNIIKQHKHFSVVTLGCRVNQCESDSLVQQLKDRGWSDPESEPAPDLVVVNTCAVTGKAAMQSRQAVRRAIRDYPDAQVVVTGCYVQTAPDDIRSIQGVSAVWGNAEKDRIPDLIESGGTGCISDITRHRQFDPVFVPYETDRTRPVLKIQDGCNAFCTYCIVPHARGRSRSMPEEEVITHIRSLAGAGFQEVVLSGIHLGAYGADLEPKSSLEILLGRIEAETSNCRVRLSSIEPGEITDGIIERLSQSNRFCAHLHIPLQSGDDDILDRMHRPYTAGLFHNLVGDIRERIPDAAIGVDVLVGFPKETEAAFERTFRLIETLPVSYLHVFPFSPRQGTPAAKMDDPVDPTTIKARCARIRKLGNEKRTKFWEQFRGRELQVLVEGKRDPDTGCLKGLSSNYIPVLLEGPEEAKNTLVSVKIARKAGNHHMEGEPLGQPGAPRR